MAGVPQAQRKQVERHFDGGIASFVECCLESVFAYLPMHDNYFWRVYLTGEYSPTCCPEYLKQGNFELLKAGLWERAGEFIRDDYVQHNPQAGQGLAGVQDYIRKTRPHREIKDTLELPLIDLIAEGDRVMTAFVRPEKDASGATYYSTWFDLYRIEDGKIAEHWDPMLKSDAPIDPNDKKI